MVWFPRGNPQIDGLFRGKSHGSLIQVVDLVGGLEHVFFVPYIGNVIIPTEEFMFFRGVGFNHQPVFLGWWSWDRHLEVPSLPIADG